MRKTVSTTIGLLIAALFLALVRTPVQASISDYQWIDPFYKEYDSFYGRYVTAYEELSTAQLLVRVYDDAYYYSNINITAVKVYFDWDQNFTATGFPYRMRYNQYHNWVISFTVPATNVASNMYTHSFIVYVEYNYSSSGSTYWSWSSGDNFAVYSMDQADAMGLSKEISAKLYYAPSYLSSDEATMMLNQARTDRNIGEMQYDQGDFALAKEYYGKAVTLFDQAYANETKYAKASDELYWASEYAQLNISKLEAESWKMQADASLIEANAMMKQAEAAMIEANATRTQADAALTTANATLNQSYAWIIFGIGFVIMSIGIMVYAMKKPKTP
jgi:tetratricopeptide (TPR) repeat protein